MFGTNDGSTHVWSLCSWHQVIFNKTQGYGAVRDKLNIMFVLFAKAREIDKTFKTVI